MPDLAHPLLVPTSGVTGTAFAPLSPTCAPISGNVLAATEVYHRRRPIYGRPSEQPTVALFRQMVMNVQAYHVAPPDRGEFRRRQITWAGAPTNKGFRALNIDVETQRRRTFGGFGPPYYQALQAPSLNDVARYMGGVINVRT